MSLVSKLNSDKALIFRISHIENLECILEHGLTAPSYHIQCKHYIQIGNDELIEKRAHRSIPHEPGGVLSDYIPFYFTPYSPMMLNIVTGRGVQHRNKDEIIIIVSSLYRIAEKNIPFVFTDRHAYLSTANYYNELSDLTKIDWQILQNRDFKKSEDDPDKVSRYQAEALIYQKIPLDTLEGLICYNDASEQTIQKQLASQAISMKVVVSPKWYF